MINLQIQKVYIVGGVLCQLSVPRSTLGFAADEEIHFNFKLSDIMHSVLPEGVRKTFVSVQKANIDLKKAKAQAVVASSAAAAAATGAAPIPFADAVVLVPEQIAMLAAITAVFGLPAEKRTIVQIISATVGTMGTTVIGRTIASSLLKLIPGAGSAVGGVISATTAAALTTALGEAYISVMVKICKGELDVKDLDSKATKLEMAIIFAEKLKIKKAMMQRNAAIKNQTSLQRISVCREV